ncbi:L-rhamnose mutarotase [Paenalcaligenes niemegkensis]|uniref:L-rhamnose mutarotase n=1 Tax=Paenalcaligenes niemegkensis TaxID=2895469 RepID=UPI0027E37559|nr:L-rhamnose mutarotase [Paenalcaligenes niemegkensis]
MMLDLKNDEQAIQEYERLHQQVWPEVEAQFKNFGVLSVDIYRLGTRLCMVMQTDDSLFDQYAFQAAQDSDPRVQEWETLMWRFQSPTPWTPAGEKWMEAKSIYQFCAGPSYVKN